ncbi:hypothetical protein K490DRAFT_68472 [Saccharata proteae CBS 121410]|uniref:Ribonuclease n=1 Tax=Saccharata proteae CBS 121410 TaxID=1314787 RepID=A0A9P4HN45_9PEZI|nr:hypothetical protein K490DRAFT_68472 [Saccharata proteae CBS 121410]
MDDQMEDIQEIAQETPADDVFHAPSIHSDKILAGSSYSHYSPIPQVLKDDMTTPCVLGVDEAGRGPVLGPMVYGLFYLPIPQHHALLAQTHHFDDSKVLTPAVRSSLMRTLCTPASTLHRSCGWATRVMSARDISAGMLKAAGTYNLNAQAMDATISLIKHVFSLGVNVQEVYIDTIGRPETYQKRLEKVFPTTKIVVAKKADSLYPCVSAASVCAKVTRDAALDVCGESYAVDGAAAGVGEGWGSGYPSDARCAGWLKRNMDPVFGWGNECRFSWGTAKDLLEAKGKGVKVEWPVEDEEDGGMKMTDFFVASEEEGGDELACWYGRSVAEEVF